MIEIWNKNNIINIKDSQWNICMIDEENKTFLIQDYEINFPWEYEKSWILVEVKEYEQKLFYSILIETKIIVVIFHDNFEMKEEIMTFFGDVDVLFIIGNKNATKIIENIEAKIVIPFWETKEIFLNSLSQHKEAVETFKIKWDISGETTEFVYLK